MQYLVSRLNIESSQAFQRLLDKTQVLTQKFGRENIIRNRLTHSYEVATAATIIVNSLSTKDFNVDYKKTIFNVCLMHDIGHPPFGHEGSEVLDLKFKEKGLKEGFSDNNNNLVVIERNNIEVSDYELASLIKYPEKLYSNQEKYKAILNKSIDEDICYFKNFINIEKRPKRTIACEIMDEADENTYVCSDLLDCYSMELDDSSALQNLLKENTFSNKNIINILKNIIHYINHRNKLELKQEFNKLRLVLNSNYILSDNINLITKDNEVLILKNKLKEISTKRYILGDYSKKKNKEGVQILNKFIDYVFKNDFIYSEYYLKKISSTNDPLKKLSYKRDMIADTADNVVIRFCEDFESKNQPCKK